jgi:hypothetical protein
VLVGGMSSLMLQLAAQVLEPGDNRLEGAMNVADFSSNVVELPSQIVDLRVVPIHAFRQEDHGADMFPKLLPHPLRPG